MSCRRVPATSQGAASLTVEVERVGATTGTMGCFRGRPRGRFTGTSTAGAARAVEGGVDGRPAGVRAGRAET